MNVFSEYDLIQAISGADEDGYGKCVVALQLKRRLANGTWKDMDEEFITEKPIVQMCKQADGYVLVDLLFHSAADGDLRIIHSYLDRFFMPENSASDDGEEFSLLTFVFMPHATSGKYWAIGTCPVFYGLVPDDRSGEPSILRVAFAPGADATSVHNFLFMATPDDEIEMLTVDEEEYGKF